VTWTKRYDLICTLLTLHHVKDVPALLRRLHPLVAPFGYISIADLDEEDGSFHGDGFDGHHGFCRELVASWLTKAGFRDVDLQTAFDIEKEGRAGLRRYPVFLATARRA
jgi:hypothetical protein